MKEKLMCALLNNINKVIIRNDSFYLRTKHDYICGYRSKKYVTEMVETRKGNWFSKPIYTEQTKIIDGFNYRLTYFNDTYPLEESEYNDIVKKVEELEKKSIEKELDKLCDNGGL